VGNMPAQCKYHKCHPSVVASIARLQREIFMYWLFHVAFETKLVLPFDCPLLINVCVFLTVFVTFNLRETHMPSWSVFMQPSELNTHGNVYRRIYLSIAFMICKVKWQSKVIYLEMRLANIVCDSSLILLIGHK